MSALHLIGRRVSDLTPSDIGKIIAKATSPSTLVVTNQGLVQSIQASPAHIGGLSGVATVGPVAWLRTHHAVAILAWCRLQAWELHPGEITLDDHRAAIHGLSMVDKPVTDVTLQDIELAQEYASATGNNALEILIEDGYVRVAHACTCLDMLYEFKSSIKNCTVIFGTGVEPIEAIAALLNFTLEIGGVK